MRVTTAPQVSHGPPPAHTHACTARTPHTSRPLGWTSGHRGGSTALATVLRAHELWFRLLAKSQPYRTVGLSLCLSRPPHPALIIHRFPQKKRGKKNKRIWDLREKRYKGVEKGDKAKGQRCTYMHMHRDFYDQTLAPKREIDVLRARSPAGSHL